PISTNFAALKEDDSVVIWGSQETERWIPGQPDNPIVDIFTTGNAFTALRSDGSIEVLWRRVSFDGEYLATDHLQSINAQLQSGVVSLKALPNRADMAALKDDGSVVSWTWTQRFPDPHKNAALGQDVAAELAGGVASLHGNRHSFAALKDDGSVVVWKGTGYPRVLDSDDYVGSATVRDELSGGVVAIASTAHAFAALKEDGSVVTWGLPNFGGTSEIRYTHSAVAPDPIDVSDDLRDGVVAVYSNSTAFTALKDDGSVVTWGSRSQGGDLLWPGNGFRDGPEALQEALSSGVTAIYPTISGFSALKEDGSVVGWGSNRPSQLDDD
ncbi:MAG: hypothetical protein P5683_25345, partial [Limnospira sp. PMC 1279.21]